jgi:hypothetical protein
MTVDDILALLIAEREKLNHAIEALQSEKPSATAPASAVHSNTTTRKKRHVSAAARRKMAAAQKKRWAAIEAAK